MNRIGVHLKDPPRQNYGTDYIQFFVIGPTDYTTVEWLNSREKRIKFRGDPRHKIVHGAYVDHPWEDTSVGKISVYNIMREMLLCDEIGAEMLLVHIASTINEKRAKEVLDKLHETYFDYGTLLVLEIDAHSNWSSHNMNKLIKMIEHHDNMGVCIDTAHLWATGTNLTTADDVRKWYKGIKNPSKIKLIHLNDNAYEMGSSRDKHLSVANPKGKIWGKDKSGIVELLKLFPKTPVILEPHNASAENVKKELKFLKKLLN